MVPGAPSVETHRLPSAVEGDVVGAGDRGHRTVPAGEVGLHRRVVRVAAEQQDVPAERGRAGPVAVLGDLDDVAVPISRPRVGRVRTGLAGGDAALGVVGAGDVDLAGGGVRLDVLAPVHRGGLDQIGGLPGEDQHLLDTHPGHRRLTVQHERHPGSPAEVVAVGPLLAAEPGDVQVALGQQGQVVPAGGVALARPVLPLGHELVEVVEPLVVTHVRGDRAVPVHPDVGPLVLEAPHRRVLARGGGGVGRVDLDDVAEPVRLVRVRAGGGVEPGIDLLPAVHARGVGQAVALAAASCRVGPEVALEVLLPGQDGAPRRGAAGAVAERAGHPAPGRVGGGPQQRTARGRAGQPEGRAGGDPTVASTTPDVAPRLPAGAPLQLDDAEAVRGHQRAQHLGLLVGAGGRGEHDRPVRVLVVAAEQSRCGRGGRPGCRGSRCCSRTAAPAPSRRDGSG